jgi:hypothetical protein
LRRWTRLLWTQESDTAANVKTLLVLLVLLLSLVPMAYLVGSAIFLAFLAFVFGMGTKHFVILNYVALVGENSLPLLGFGAIGLAGLLLWPSARRWPYGLAAIVLETVAAIWIYLMPEGMLSFLGMFE